MRAKFLCSVLTILLLAGATPACTHKKTEPTPAPTSNAPEGEKAQAQGTAEMAKAPAAQPETVPTGECSYSTDPKAITLGWTAYKFTEKKAVKGSFTTTNVQGPNSAKTLAALAEGLRMEIDGASFESGDPGRNATVKDFFFGKFNPAFKLEAVAKKLTGSDTEGNLTIEIKMNGTSKEVPFTYTANGQGEFIAKGGINLLDWQLKAALDSLHQACEVQHTGPDGVSKTWEVVDLEIKGKFTKACPGSPAVPAAQVPAPSAPAPQAPGPQGP
jgi:polyisoprenoid-binding protein YceI